MHCIKIPRVQIIITLHIFPNFTPLRNKFIETCLLIFDEIQKHELWLQKWLNSHTIFHFPLHPFEEYTKRLTNAKRTFNINTQYRVQFAEVQRTYNERFALLLLIFTNKSNKSFRTIIISITLDDTKYKLLTDAPATRRHVLIFSFGASPNG